MLAHTEGGLISMKEDGDWFRFMIRRSGRKGCRDVIGAIVVVDRVETTIKDNIMEIPNFLIHNFESERVETDNGTEKGLYRLKV